MKKLFLFIILTFFSIKVSGQNIEKSKEINVLFIGNSLTYFNNMPQILQKMVNETDPNINIEQITYPGFSLDAHLENVVEESSEDNVKTRKKLKGELTETQKKIQERNWDIIVMQTGGVNVLIPEFKNSKIDPAIQEIINLSECNSKYILFNTWTPRISYPKKCCYPAVIIDRTAKPGEKFCSPLISNEKDYSSLLELGYEELAQKNNLILSDHGQLFQKMRKSNPEIKLLEDEMHPSKNGAYLSASIFYEMITGKEAENLKYTSDLKVERQKF